MPSGFEAVAIFHGVPSLDEAVESLVNASFDREDISPLASEATVEEMLGHRYQRVEDLEDDLEAPHVPYRTLAEVADNEYMIAQSLIHLPAVIATGTVVASAGVLAAALSRARRLPTGLTTAMRSHLQEPLEHGGLLTWVNTPTAEGRDVAVRILMGHASSDVHVHELAQPGPEANRISRA